MRASFCGRQEEIEHRPAFKSDHCVSLYDSHTINNMSCASYSQWRKLMQRIKTFICMRTVCSFSLTLSLRSWMTIWFYGEGWGGVVCGPEMWRHLLLPTQKPKNFFLHGNLFKFLFGKSFSNEFSSSELHTIGTAMMTWLFMVNDFLAIALSLFHPAERPLR